MSGGVDSSVAAALMLRQGYECAGLTLKLHKHESAKCSQDQNDAREAALKLGIPHSVLDITEEFEKQVICRFVEIYEDGATPNPCVICNRYIKFNFLLQSLQNDFNCFATGHYARVEKDPAGGRYLLKKAVDEKKDQSYVLYNLTQEQLQYACFPLGGFSKGEVRKIAKEINFENAEKGESQDICFVPHGDYGDFIESFTGRPAMPGDILDTGGRVLGRHRGIIRCTIGQRRGLGVAANTPVYVAAKSAETNTVTLGPEESLYSKSLIANDINLVTCSEIKKPMRVMVKTRYLQSAQSALAEQVGEDSLHIEFDAPQRAITPGQAAVMYDGDIVIGGGTII